MLRKNKEGIAFVMVLILLSVVGILAAVLLRTSRTHVNTAIHEEIMSQTFYAADSGVEFAKAYSNKIFDEINKDDDNKYINMGSDNEIILVNEKEWINNFNDDINFNIKIQEIDQIDDEIENITLLSEGNYRSTNKEINFELTILRPDFDWDDTFPTGEDKNYDEDEDHYDLAGKDSGDSIEDSIDIRNWREEYEDWNDFWTSNTKNEFNELSDFPEHMEGDQEIKEHISENIISIENGNLTISGNTEIKKTIIIVDGALENVDGTPTIENSFLIIKDYTQLNGTPKFTDSVVLIYGDESNDDGNYIEDSGSPATIDEDGGYSYSDRPSLGVRIENWEQQ